jgi:uncharacterized phage-associated protein
MNRALSYRSDLKLESEISDFLLAESRERGEHLTNLKLQKLLFYSDAWNLALFDIELFPEQFQAWVHGPVLLSQYNRFKKYKWQPITDEIKRPKLDAQKSAHLIEIVDIFGSETAVALELMTHRELPWLDARGGILPTEPSTALISKSITREYYKSL